MHKTKAEWKSKVTEMLQEETDVPDSDVATIVEYLARSFPGTVNVNKATAKDLETVGGLSAKDAAAIVQYREANGNFKTLDDLKKVPDVDTVKLDARKQTLEFQ
jgi:competence protein ComEA